MSLLSIKDLSINFGGVLALNRVSLNIGEREIHGLIGPNGAGKTTLINCLSRFYTPSSGQMDFAGKSLLSYAAHQVPGIGIRRTFQEAKIHPDLTVLENLLAGQHSRTTSSLISSLLRMPSARREERELKKTARLILKFIRRIREASERPQAEAGYPALYGRGGYPDLIDLEDYPGGTLPYGPRKRLDIARALITKPKLLLLDEPAGGSPHAELDELAKLILSIRDEYNVSILLVEHHMSLVMKVCDRISVLDFGSKIAEGTPTEIQNDPKVIDAYLGTSTNVLKEVSLSVSHPETENRKQSDLSRNFILELNKADVFYGPVLGISGVSIAVREGEITALLGTNGAGKTTVLKAISGIENLSEGSLYLQGEKLADRAIRLKPHKAVRRGIVQVAEGRQLFLELSVYDNLLLGGFSRSSNLNQKAEKCLHYFPALKPKLKFQAGSLSGGEQQMLAIAQALMAEPVVLLLDEPSLGLAPRLVEKVFEIIRSINQQEGVTILLVEQNATQALNLSSFAYIMEAGRVVKSGPSKELLLSKVVQETYLGM